MKNSITSETELPEIAENSFAEACYDNNSLSELQADGLTADDADAEDLRVWGITPDEWLYSLKLAYAHKLRDIAPEPGSYADFCVDTFTADELHEEIENV